MEVEGSTCSSEVEKLIQLLSEGLSENEILLPDFCKISGHSRDKKSRDEAVAKVERIATAQGLDPDQLSSLMQFILGDSGASTCLHV